MNPYARMYDARMDIYRHEKVMKGNITSSERRKVASEIPCRYSLSSGATLQEPAAVIQSSQKLFCGLDVDIREGDYIVVTLRTGKVVELTIGECHPYTFQWQCEVKRDEKA